jgi:hypothetical protein
MYRDGYRERHCWLAPVDYQGVVVMSIRLPNDESAIRPAILAAGAAAAEVEWAVDIVNGVVGALLAEAGQPALPSIHAPLERAVIA